MKKLLQLLILTSFILAKSQPIDVVYDVLVWSDEFQQNGAIDASKWHHQTIMPNGFSWFNGEQQHYTNRINNSFVSDGNLNIVAKREQFTQQGHTKQFTSARLNSKFAFRYGRVDVRAKVPKNQGTWPAIWLLGKNISEVGAYFFEQFGSVGWPACGEIDIMEHGIFHGSQDNFISSALHTPSSHGNTINHGGVVAPNNIQDNFNVYSMNWSPNQITFMLNEVPYYTYAPAVKNASTWPFDAEQFLLLNIAMGGVAGAIPSAFNEASMIIDYVRVYQNETLSVDQDHLPKFTIINPAKDFLMISNNHLINQVEIYDLNGRLVLSENKIQNSININGLNQGVYMVLIYADNLQIQKQKLVIN